MKECDNCLYGGWLNGKDAITEICKKCRYICGEPTKWKAKLMTNAERIRAMSDEELADVLDCPKGLFDRMDCFYTDKDCDECILEWLKQSAEVDNGR